MTKEMNNIRAHAARKPNANRGLPLGTIDIRKQITKIPPPTLKTTPPSCYHERRGIYTCGRWPVRTRGLSASTPVGAQVTYATEERGRSERNRGRNRCACGRHAVAPTPSRGKHTRREETKKSESSVRGNDTASKRDEGPNVQHEDTTHAPSTRWNRGPCGGGSCSKQNPDAKTARKRWKERRLRPGPEPITETPCGKDKGSPAGEAGGRRVTGPHKRTESAPTAGRARTP